MKVGDKVIFTGWKEIGVDNDLKELPIGTRMIIKKLRLDEYEHVKSIVVDLPNHQNYDIYYNEFKLFKENLTEVDYLDNIQRNMSYD